MHDHGVYTRHITWFQIIAQFGHCSVAHSQNIKYMKGITDIVFGLFSHTNESLFKSASYLVPISEMMVWQEVFDFLPITISQSSHALTPVKLFWNKGRTEVRIDVVNNKRFISDSFLQSSSKKYVEN